MKTLLSNFIGPAKSALLIAGMLLSAAPLAGATTYSYRVPAKGVVSTFAFEGGGAPASVPAPPFIVQVATGSYCSLLLASDGSLWTSGKAMADGTGNRGKAFKKIATTDKFISVAAGSNHILAVRDDGTLWGSGQTMLSEFMPSSGTQNTLVQVAGMTNVVSVIAGESYSMALKSDGSLWGTGAGGGIARTSWGRLNAADPTKVYSQMGGTWRTNLLLEPNGTLWAFGADDFGQAGDGMTGNNRWIGFTQVGGSDKFVAVAAADNHSLAIKVDGSLWGTGIGQYGNYGGTSNSSTFVPTAVGQTFTAVAGGPGYSLAIHTDGTIWGTGTNSYGELGDGTLVSRSTFARSTTEKYVKVVTSFGGGTLALRSDGTVWAAGYDYMQLGLNGVGTVRSFTKVPLPLVP